MDSTAAQAASGFIAGMVSTAILHPLDVVKTRFQVDEAKRAQGVRETMRVMKSIFAGDGSAGLYRGLTANVAGSSLSWCLYFGLYDSIKKLMGGGEVGRGTNTSRLHAVNHMTASFLAGASTCLVTNPLWLVKTRMCAESVRDPGAYRSLWDGLTRTYKGEGIRGLYKGLGMSIVGASHGAVQFMAYEELKKWRSQGGAVAMACGPSDFAVMSVASKVIAMIVTYPYQVVRARIQNQRVLSDAGHYRSTLKTIRHILRGEGVLGFYKGIGPALIRVIPGTVITFVVYETVIKSISKR